MRLLAFAAAAAMVGGGAYLYQARAVPPGTVYPRGTAEALALIAQAGTPTRLEEVLSMAGTGLGSVERRNLSEETVLYTLKVDGVRVADYRVGVAAIDAHNSRVTTDFTMTADAAKQLKSLIFPADKLVGEVGRQLLEEGTDAALDGRPFDDSIYKRAITRLTIGNMPQMGANLRTTFAEVGAIINENAAAVGAVDAAPGRQPVAPPNVRFVPGRPMVSARPPSGY